MTNEEMDKIWSDDSVFYIVTPAGVNKMLYYRGCDNVVMGLFSFNAADAVMFNNEESAHEIAAKLNEISDNYVYVLTVDFTSTLRVAGRYYD